jgi:hypothetical protein
MYKDRCRQPVLPEVVGLPPGELVGQVWFGAAAHRSRGQHGVLELAPPSSWAGELGQGLPWGMASCPGGGARGGGRRAGVFVGAFVKTALPCGHVEQVRLGAAVRLGCQGAIMRW